MVRNRINWVNGLTGEIQKSSRNYNAFVLFSNNIKVMSRFKFAFSDLGKIERSVEV